MTDNKQNNKTIDIEASWYNALQDEFGKEYFTQLRTFLREEKNKGIRIFPPGKQIFSAFNYTPFDKVKVVIIGQDPYHGEGQANGLCFSVADGIKQPPSLQNIFKELNVDVGMEKPTTGNLEPWAKQGVFLLNAILTVRANEPASHSKAGWQQFTDAVISTISKKREGVVFFLWGNFAKQKAQLIDSTKHHILTAAHPSPLAGGAFFGCKHFSATNNILMQHGLSSINWALK
nr:uracil-DNA glycosylase [Bacteroidota bacterium]